MRNSTIAYIGILVFFLAACGNQTERAAYFENYNEESYNPNNEYARQSNGAVQNEEQQYQAEQQQYQPKQVNNAKPKVARGNGKIVMKTMKDNNNRLIGQIPLPANWKFNPNVTKSNPATILGPNGIKTYNYAGQSFVYSNDSYMQQLYQQAGQQMKRPKGADRVMKEDIAPLAQKEGSTFIRQYSLPSIAQANKNYDSNLWKVMPVQQKFDAVASEWRDKNGNMSMIIVNYFESPGQGMTIWGYQCSGLEAPEKEFEAAKNTYINGLVGIQYAASHFQEINQREQQRANASNSAHQSRMAQNQANFNAQQQALKSSNDAVNNSIMSSYNTQNASSDRIQQQMLNAINDENTVYNSTNGQTYQVESGANQTWMNSNGEYIQSNDYNWNPNTDNNTNNSNWEQTQQVDYYNY